MSRLGSLRNRFAVLVVLGGIVALTAAIAEAAAPQGNWVGLASGRVGAFEWSVKVKRPGVGIGAGRANVQRTCLLVGASWPVGRYSYGRIKARQCSGESGRLSAVQPPLIAAGPQPARGSSAKVTAVGMVFAPAARRLRVTLSGGKVRTIHLQSAHGQARDPRLGRLRYAAFVVHGSWCAERLVSQDAAGRTLWDSGTDGYSCSPAP